jgi:hypothetical protein
MTDHVPTWVRSFPARPSSLVPAGAGRTARSWMRQLPGRFRPTRRTAELRGVDERGEVWRRFDVGAMVAALASSGARVAADGGG